MQSVDRCMDSGCFYHMTPNREWFTIYMSCNFDSVNVDNNKSYVVGMGQMHISMDDDGVRTLCEATGTDVDCYEFDLTWYLASQWFQMEIGIPSECAREALTMTKA